MEGAQKLESRVLEFVCSSTPGGWRGGLLLLFGVHIHLALGGPRWEHGGIDGKGLFFEPSVLLCLSSRYPFGRIVTEQSVQKLETLQGRECLGSEGVSEVQKEKV